MLLEENIINALLNPAPLSTPFQPQPLIAAQPAAGEVRQALAAILSSVQFRRSPKLSHLLSYLIEKQLANLVRDINQYSIGADVFDRDPRTYDPGDDPIVRVQMGRLRDKLKAYYAAIGDSAACIISIPVGGYLPQVLPGRAAAPMAIDTLAVLPVGCVSEDLAFLNFTRGLGDELSYQLFLEFGPSRVVSGPAGADRSAQSHVLESSIRIEEQRIRASFRMVQVRGNCLIWCEQLDTEATLSISLQEKISGFVRAALRRHIEGISYALPAIFSRPASQLV